MWQPTAITQTFLKSSIQGIPYGQGVHVEAGHGSRVGLKGPDQLKVRLGQSQQLIYEH